MATYQCCHNNKTRRWYDFDIRSFNAKMQFSSFFVFFFGKVKRQVNLNFQCRLNVCQHSIDKRNKVSQRKLQFYIWMNRNMTIPDYLDKFLGSLFLFWNNWIAKHVCSYAISVIIPCISYIVSHRIFQHKLTASTIVFLATLNLRYMLQKNVGVTGFWRFFISEQN